MVVCFILFHPGVFKEYSEEEENALIRLGAQFIRHIFLAFLFV
jgi:hypothetical protein